MKGTMKLLAILLLAVVVLVSVNNVCYAQLDPGDINPTYGDGTATTKIKETAGKILGLIRNIAVVGGVILLAVLGLKYMFGSAEEKAGYQKSFVPLIVGIVLVMSATTVASLIFGMLK